MNTSISQIEEVFIDSESNKVTVIAIVEDAVLSRPSTWFDPPEYEPAICETSFYLDDYDLDLNNHQALRECLDDFEWNVIRDYYDD